MWHQKLHFHVSVATRKQNGGRNNDKSASLTFEIKQCWIFAVLWWPFWKWRPVEIFRCRESIQDAEIGQCWICAALWWPFWKWWPLEIFQRQESIRDIIIYSHMKCRWNRTMLNLCGIVVAILKMATARNFSMSGINSGHHNLPTYEMSLKSDNVEFVQHCGDYFRNGDS